MACDFDSLDRMNVFVGEEGYGNDASHRYIRGENMQMIYQAGRHNPNQTIEQLKVKSGSSLVFTLKTQTRPHAPEAYSRDRDYYKGYPAGEVLGAGTDRGLAGYPTSDE